MQCGKDAGFGDLYAGDRNSLVDVCGEDCLIRSSSIGSQR